MQTPMQVWTATRHCDGRCATANGRVQWARASTSTTWRVRRLHGWTAWRGWGRTTAVLACSELWRWCARPERLCSALTSTGSMLLLDDVALAREREERENKPKVRTVVTEQMPLPRPPRVTDIPSDSTRRRTLSGCAGSPCPRARNFECMEVRATITARIVMACQRVSSSSACCSG